MLDTQAKLFFKVFNVKKYLIDYYYDSFIGSSSEIRIFSKPAETNTEGVQNQEDWPVGNLNYFWVAFIFTLPTSNQGYFL